MGVLATFRADALDERRRYPMIAAEIAAALGGACRSGGWYRCRCPVHQSTGPTLALRDGPRGLIAHCHAGCSRDDVLAELGRLGPIDGAGSAEPPNPAELARQREAEDRKREKRIADALYLWQQETINPDRSVVERYWAIRGLGDLVLRQPSVVG
jgi:hypothetical protein